MLKWCLGLAAFAGLAIGGYALAQPGAAAGQDNDRIAHLIKQLGSSKYAEREKAKKDLENIGMPALEQLRKASKDSDLETSRRCQELIKKLEDVKAVEDLLAPKLVKLNYKDTPVMKAIEDLEKQSGYQIIVDGDRVPLAKRTVTLQTGEIPFWEALDKLCQAAKLAEVISSYRPVYQTDVDLPNILLPPGGGVVPLPAPAPPPPPLPQAVPPGAGNVQPGNPGPEPRPLKRGAIQPEEAQAGPDQPVAARVQVVRPAVGNAQAGGGQAMPGIAVDLPLQQGQVQPGAVGQAQPGQVQILPAPAMPPGQVQIQPVPVQPQPAIKRGGRTTPVRVYQPGTIVVRDGNPEKVPTSYHGALRVRLLPASKATEIHVPPAQRGESLYVLEVAAEPRLQQFAVVGAPRIDKALDDLGQQLTLAMEPMPGEQGGVARPNRGNVPAPDIAMLIMPNQQPRQVALRLKLGENQAKILKELTGSLTVQAQNAVPDPIITVDNVLKAKGKTAQGQSGGSIEVKAIDKMANGNYRVKIAFENPPQQGPGFFGAIQGGINGMAVQIQVANVQAVGPNGAMLIDQPFAGNQSMPVLVDAKGKAWTIAQLNQSDVMVNNNQIIQELTMTFRAGAGVGEPAQMVLYGYRMVTAQVPFRFEGIPLP